MSMKGSLYSISVLMHTSAGKVRNGHEILLCVELKDPAQYIACYAMCDDIGMWYLCLVMNLLTNLAGTMRYAELKLELQVFSFLPRSRDKTNDSIERTRMNTSRPRSNDISHDKNRSRYQTDIFDGDDLDFEDFLAAGTYILCYNNTNLAHSCRPGDRLAHLGG